MGLALQLSVIWELDGNALSLARLPAMMLIQWVGVERGAGGRVVLTCPCEAAHASGCRGHPEHSLIVSSPLLNTRLGFYRSEKRRKGGPMDGG